jgi:hypothetical protein
MRVGLLFALNTAAKEAAYMIETMIRNSRDKQFRMVLYLDKNTAKYVLAFNGMDNFEHEEHYYDHFGEAFDAFAKNMRWYNNQLPQPCTEEEFLGLKKHTLYPEDKDGSR